MEKNMNNFVVDFQVTSRCNLKCKFCCGADKNKIDVTFDEICNAVDKLASIGTDRIVITGGEPLIRTDIDEIIKYIHKKGINVYLSTNGCYIEEHIDIVNKYVDCVGLPLDGNDHDICYKMSRNSNQIETTFNAMQIIRKYCPDVIIKIGTVVSKINQKNIESIGNILYNNASNVSPNVWRLYQFTPLRRGRKE